MVLAEAPARPRDVEVAQAGRGETPGRGDGPDHAVHRELGGAVGVGRERGRGLGYWHLFRLAVDRGGRGEDEPGHPGLDHRLQQVQGAADVVAVVALRLLDGLADQRERSEVQDSVEALRNGAARTLVVEQVARDEPGPFRDRRLVSLREVVQDHRLVAGLDQLVGEDRKSTRLNSSHANISYAVFCLKKTAN